MHHLPLIYLIHKLKNKKGHEVNKIIQNSAILLFILLTIYIIYLNMNNLSLNTFYNTAFTKIASLDLNNYIKFVFNDNTQLTLWIIITLYISYLIIYKVFYK